MYLGITRGFRLILGEQEVTTTRPSPQECAQSELFTECTRTGCARTEVYGRNVLVLDLFRIVWLECVRTEFSESYGRKVFALNLLDFSKF